jgi:hypothetical protein
MITFKRVQGVEEYSWPFEAPPFVLADSVAKLRCRYLLDSVEVVRDLLIQGVVFVGDFAGRANSVSELQITENKSTLKISLMSVWTHIKLVGYLTLPTTQHRNRP